MRIVPVTAARARRIPQVATRDAIRLRCLTPADADQMTDLLARMSPDSLYQRYFRLVRSFSPAVLARFVAVGPNHLAVGAFEGDVLVGVAQYFRSSTNPDHAEVAVEVADSHHRRGVGSRLVRELARLAAGHGITHLTATVLAENRAVLGLMRGSGWDIASTPDGPYIDVVVTLPPVPCDAAVTRSRPRPAVGAGAGAAPGGTPAEWLRHRRRRPTDRVAGGAPCVDVATS